MRFFSLWFISFVLLCSFSRAQMDKGDKYYNQNRYIKAIPHYKKASTKPAYRETALVKLGNCYSGINEYQKAEETYRMALAANSKQEPDFYLKYASALKTLGKYEEALVQYNEYLKLKPTDQNAKNVQKFCAEIKYWLAKPIEYAIKPVEGINTEFSEFSPVYFQGKLIFSAERITFDFVDFERSDYGGEPYLNLYISKADESKISSVKPLSKKINTDNHDGPACISASGDVLYFTRVETEGKNNTAKIYVAKGRDRNWSDIKPFEYNSKEYSVAHPSISHDNQYLFFTSDMPGGYGGKDIWVCKRNGDGWDKPINLGPDINTSGNEMFPCIRANGILYFSSNGLPGYGGYDIYTARQLQGKWILNRNEGLNLNSGYDDFGITFVNDTLGYFSSNRVGGKGKDDIYRFVFTDKSLIISGTVLLTEDASNPVKGVSVSLKEENGDLVGTTKTDNKGYFEFRNLDADKKYMAIIDNTDPQFSGKARYYLSDGNNVIQRVTNKHGSDKFVFRNLPVDPNGLPDLYTNDDLTLAGNLLYGENPSKPLKNSRIKLVNEYGDVIEQTTTNQFGAFTFRNIPSDQNYLISIEESDISLPENTKITLTNKSGKEIKTFYTGKGKFNFKILAADKNTLQEMDANDDNLVMDIFGFVYDENRKPLVNTKIKIKEEGKQAAESEINTSSVGKFNFRNLRADKNYIFEADENDPTLKNVKKIYIADNKGRIYKVIHRDGEGKFTFKILEADKSLLGDFVVDDPWLAVLEMKNKKDKEALTIIENIYYGLGDYKFDSDGQKVLDKVISVLQTDPNLQIELSSHTDSRASDDFNLNLSKKRAQFAVDYIISKGIDKKRLKAIGYGETRLLNRCANNVECSDEEHKINRRTEFKITEVPLK